ncbi:hypothetical protein F7734_27480 [Scytonema sp. UIC 10036]|uniref:hypothetical protein n=1 Tax=Scytonema sp. UIC 10036 TaxID=2304196 RepID=UPI0012DA7FFC|nr:hypothetical protein [Scytonema sp. UIC 10036]MUG95890.1 hypothetical protein [Scytonema sp. UIC 10036]
MFAIIRLSMSLLINPRPLLSKFYDACISCLPSSWVSSKENLNFLAQKIKAFALLFLGVSVISSGSILIKLSEVELSSNVTIFNRFWIASLVFGLLSGYKAIRQRFFSDRPVKQQSYTSHDLLLLLCAGIFWA